MQYAVMALLTVALAGPAIALDLRTQKPVISYEAFTQLNDAERRERFDRYDPETKSFLMRTHATRWLERNRARLSKTQIALLQELIDLLPSAFAGTPEIHARSKALLDKLACQLSHTDIVSAVRPDMTPPRTNWLGDIWEWLSNCASAEPRIAHTAQDPGDLPSANPRARLTASCSPGCATTLSITSMRRAGGVALSLS